MQSNCIEERLNHAEMSISQVSDLNRKTVKLNHT